MRKNFFLLLIFLSTGAMNAKSIAPNWMDAFQREALYPSEKYYTGFASAKSEEGVNKSDIYDQVQQNARLAALSSIQVSVEQTIDRFIQNSQSQGSASTIDVMTSRAKSRTSLKDVPDLKVDVWENPKNGEVYAFAWIKKADLSIRLMRRIAVNIGKLETEVRNTETLIEKGEKMQAKNSLPTILSMLDDIGNDQRVMLSIDASLSDEDLLLNDVNHLKELCRSLSLELKNSINIYLEYKADLLGMNYSTLKSSIQGELSSLGCNFLSDEKQADWIIYLTALAREYNTISYGSRVTTYVVYVDADLAIEKVATNQRVYENQLSKKGIHTLNYEQAARQAYEDIVPMLSAIIIEQIQH